MAGLAPAEKSEHLIYTILPISVGIFLVAYLNFDISNSLGIITLFVPIFTVLLYELSPDEILVKRRYRKKIISSYTELKKSFVANHLLIKFWENTIESIPKSDEIESFVSNSIEDFIESTIDGQTARRQFWRIRAIYYLYVSLPVLIAAGFFLLSKAIIIEILWASILYSTYLAIIELLLYSANKKRHEKLPEFLTYLTMFSIWSVMIFTDRIQHPSYYTKSDPIESIPNELNTLELILLRGYRVNFLTRWKRVHKSILDYINSAFMRNFKQNLLVLWGKLHFEKRKGIDVNVLQRRYQWYIILWYLYPSLDKNNRKYLTSIIESYIKQGTFADLIVNDVMKELLSLANLLRPDGNETNDAGDISRGLTHYLDHSGTNLHKLIKKYVEQFHMNKFDIFDRELMAKTILKYIEEEENLDVPRSILDTDVQTLERIYVTIPQDDNRYLFIKKYTENRVFDVERLIPFLSNKVWEEDLMKPEVYSILRKRYDELEKTSALEAAFSSYLNRRREFI